MIHLFLGVALASPAPVPPSPTASQRPLVDTYWIPEDVRAKIPRGWAARLLGNESCGDGPIYMWNPAVVDVALADRIWYYEFVIFWIPKDTPGTPAFDAALAGEVERVRAAASSWLPTPQTPPPLRPFLEAASTVEGARADVAQHAMMAWRGLSTAPLLEPVGGLDVASACAAPVAVLPTFTDAGAWWEGLQATPLKDGRPVGDSWFNCMNKLIREHMKDPADLAVEAMEKAGAVYVGNGEGGGC